MCVSVDRIWVSKCTKTDIHLATIFAMGEQMYENGNPSCYHFASTYHFGGLCCRPTIFVKRLLFLSFIKKFFLLHVDFYYMWILREMTHFYYIIPLFCQGSIVSFPMRGVYFICNKQYDIQIIVGFILG